MKINFAPVFFLRIYNDSWINRMMNLFGKSARCFHIFNVQMFEIHTTHKNVHVQVLDSIRTHTQKTSFTSSCNMKMKKKDQSKKLMLRYSHILRSRKKNSDRIIATMVRIGHIQCVSNFGASEKEEIVILWSVHRKFQFPCHKRFHVQRMYVQPKFRKRRKFSCSPSWKKEITQTE